MNADEACLIWPIAVTTSAGSVSCESAKVGLKVVLIINACMFFVIVAAVIYAGSTALLSDSLDNLGDAITHALSLYAVGLGVRTKARVALSQNNWPQKSPKASEQ
ncbi:MAG: hypothetical protein HY525_13260 [Betaproteobacteria bacterium]|nr:hypothetical protein [Betaproteobacteria bacterium]